MMKLWTLLSLSMLLFSLVNCGFSAQTQNSIPIKETLTNNEISNQSAMVLSNSGHDASCAWIENNNQIYASFLAAGQVKWTKPQLIAAYDFPVKNLNLASNRAGQFVLTWQSFNEQMRSTLMCAFFSTQVGMWTTPHAISLLNKVIVANDVAINTAGRIAVTWEEIAGLFHVIKYSEFMPNMGWSKAVQISSTERNAYAPRVILDEEGGFIINWIRKENKKNIIESFVSPANQEWIAPADLN